MPVISQSSSIVAVQISEEYNLFEQIEVEADIHVSGSSSPPECENVSNTFSNPEVIHADSR